MSRLVINGGQRLSGEISVGGSKNAALPIIFACIATRGVSEIDNLPDIADVDVALEILSLFGAVIRREGARAIIDTRVLTYTTLPGRLTSALRASTYLLGACLARFSKVDLCAYGGCSFGDRPIDMHISAAESLGAHLSDGILLTEGLTQGIIRFNKISVGATVNALIMCSVCHGESRIYGYAREPHVFSLIDFLRLAGAKIFVYEEFISVEGGMLGSSYSYIIPDMIEAGTYLAISLATESDLTVVGANAAELASFSDFLRLNGATVEEGSGCMRALGGFCRFAELETGPYPSFPTDLQPQMAPIMAKFFGGSIVERVWRERFRYLDELSRLGVSYNRFDSGARIFSSVFTSGNATATDLRGGAALLIAALSAKGESVIDSAEIIRRGYADLVSKLALIGAKIKEVN